MKKCRICKTEFSPRSTTQILCSHECAFEYVKQQAQKRVRKEVREAKEKIKSKADWMREAQAAFNKYIRARDSEDPCISCNRYHQGQYHAGHYRSTKAAPELRFDELNVHKQCQPCNTHLSGNIVEYRKNLVEIFGEEKVQWLEGKHEPKHYTIEELKEIKRKYSQLAKGLEND